MLGRRAPWALSAALAIALCARAALADDSTAGLENGGVVLTKSSTIQMLTETLYISAQAIRVHYTFENTSSKDVTVTLAFPLPDLTIEDAEQSVMIPNWNSNNFMNFTTTVDGKPLSAQLLQKAVKNGVDQSGYLRSLGLPLAPFLQSTNQALNHLSKAQQDQLVAMGLAASNHEIGPDAALVATWTLQSEYVWNATFPAGKVVAIEHDYTPSVASRAGADWGSAEAKADTADRAKYCVDDDFIAGASKGHFLNEERIDYVLVTGANWAGPIGDFTMTIDKGAPTSLVSFCGTGVTKTGPTTFEVRYKSFTPTSNVSVLLLPAPGSQ